jgi:tRNA G37 N-methylase TrmD
MGYEVPEILREGHHKKIEEWREQGFMFFP